MGEIPHDTDPPAVTSALGEPVLEIRGLEVAFGSGDDAPVAVRGIDLTARRGRVLGVVGESGSGKSVSMLAVMGLLGAGSRVSGSVRLHDRELVGARARELRAVRGRDLAMVFQDPMSSLNPVLSIGDQIAEAITIHNPRTSDDVARARAIELLAAVGIPAPAERCDDYPHQFSGGMRQRVVIAIAMANDPAVLIADEPTTALDVTVQAQILELLRDLCETRGTSVVIISHDLGVVSGLADEIAVMYAGRVVEHGSTDDVFYRCAHPYTRGLLAAVPRVDSDAAELVSISGTPPTPGALPPGCAFTPRCGWAQPACAEAVPDLVDVGPTASACIRAHELDARTPAARTS